MERSATRRALPGLAALALCLAAGPAAAQPEPVRWISPHQVVAGADGYSPRDLSVADLDGDGAPDVIAVVGQTLRLLLNRVHGAASAQHILDLPWARQAAGADLDLDGRVDLAVTSGNALYLLRRPGDDFGAWEQVQIPGPNQDAGARPFVRADLNGDGHTDLVVCDGGGHALIAAEGGPVVVRLWEGNYTWSAPRIGDIDGDGDLDGLGIANPRGGDPVLVWLRNDGLLPWQPVPLDALTGGWNPDVWPDLADVDGQPGLEIVAGLDRTLRVATVVPQVGPWVAYPVDSPSDDVVALDLDGDGDQDLLSLAHAWFSALVVLENRGPQGWAAQIRHHAEPIRFSSGGRTLWADQDGDADPDVVVDNDFTGLGRYTIRRGAVQAVVTDPPRAPGERRGGESTVALEVDITPLVPLEPAARLTALHLWLALDQRTDRDPASVIDRIEVIRDLAPHGDPENDVTVTEVPGAGLGAEATLPLPDLGLPTGGRVQLRIVAHLTADAHVHADTVQVAWRGLTADQGGAPLAVADSLPAGPEHPLPNLAPTATGDAGEVAEGGQVTLDLLANDSDPWDDPLSVEVVEPPAHGELTIEADGRVTYTHDGSEAPLADAFTYRASDGGATSAPVAVALTITPVNDAPVGGEDAYQTDEDVPLVVGPDLGLLLNDTDAEGDLLVVELVAGPSHGALDLQPDGSFVYVPAPDFAGEDTFTYRPDDGDDLGEPVEVTLVITPTNDAPTPADGDFATAPGQPVRLQLAGVDPEGGDAWLQIEAFPDRGHLVELDAAAAQVTYVPPRGFTGQARFAYRLSDGQTISEVVEAVITVGD